ncbi:hypothetical protein BDN72DRAFT_847143 [Pluteus cervinus]|uniref:Uncharacterized protein n=1 Tax=Pluteus cervinus TaxID=181527 RepID=A0ACD3AER0_9AGAR|nr:hypothetical protein BDN72DRAFT_847143 [Pluteus cervinus]
MKSPTSPSTTHSFILPTLYTSQASIDSEISRLQGKIRELRSARNALAPISRLPPEVLVQIFGWLQDKYRHELSRNFNRLKRPPRDVLDIAWTRVTHVSGHWRGIARGFPSLWNRVSLANHHWLRQSLFSSRPLPLILEEKQLSSPQLSALHRVLDCFSRIRIFNISESPIPFDSVSSYFSQPAPELEVFRLLASSRCVDLPNDTFKGVSPRLRHVALSNFSLSWDKATFLENLTTLTVHSPISRVNIDTLATILRRMPCLVYLDLKDVLEIMSRWTEDENAYFSSVEPVNLPSLEAFNFEGSFLNQDRAFITRLRFPGRTQVKFHSALEIAVNQAFPQILSTFIQTRLDEVAQIRSMTFLSEQEYDRSTVTLSWENISSPTLSSFDYEAVGLNAWPPPALSSISLEGRHTIRTFAADWILELQNLPLGPLEFFRTNVEVTSGVLWTILGDLANLKTVSLDGASGTFLLQHLIDNHATFADNPVVASSSSSTTVDSVLTSTDSNDNPQTPFDPTGSHGWTNKILPSLCEIHLNETNYEHVQLQSLVQAFATRKAYGLSLRLLSLKECRNLEEGLIDKLKEVIDEVDWDGTGINIQETDFIDLSNAAWDFWGPSNWPTTL